MANPSNFQQRLFLGDGSASGPSGSFLSDSQMGLFYKSAGVMGIAIAGAEVMNLSASGISVTGGIIQTGIKRIFSEAAKVGTTSGWVVGAANNLGVLATCPASQSGSTLVVPISGLQVGSTITSFHLIGQIESGGNAVVVDADLRVLTAVAADITDASVGAMAQLSVIADSVMSVSNTNKASLTQAVTALQSYYVLITVTTLGATDIALQGVAVTVTGA